MHKEKNDVIDVIKKVMPAVVSIVISKRLEEVEKEMPLDLLPAIPFKGKRKIEIPEEDIDAHGMVHIGGGSGFIVDADGIIVTNKHVLADQNASYTVITSSGVKHDAEIIARDPIDDIGILSISAKRLPTVPLGDSSTLELGQTVIAIGNALGIFKNTVSRGIISGLSRAISAQADPKSPLQEMRGLIQTDAAINPGNSGGPLVNIFGEAIGINAAVVFGAQNIGFAIPVNAARRDLADIKVYGKVRRPLLGLRYLTVNEFIKDKFELSVDYGALVVSHGHGTAGVIEDSPADKAGIHEKDIVLEFNGKKISADTTIQDYLEDALVDDVVTLTVLRGKKTLAIKVALAERK